MRSELLPTSVKRSEPLVREDCIRSSNDVEVVRRNRGALKACSAALTCPRRLSDPIQIFAGIRISLPNCATIFTDQDIMVRYVVSFSDIFLFVHMTVMTYLDGKEPMDMLKSMRIRKVIVRYNLLTCHTDMHQ
jgi:hypothetical protein